MELQKALSAFLSFAKEYMALGRVKRKASVFNVHYIALQSM